MQPVDLTTLVAVCHELTGSCLPARLEQVYQSDRHTLYLCLRTLEKQLWLLLSWHPQAARLHLTEAPPHQPDTFTFSQQIWHQVAGLALVNIKLVDPWERVVDLQFAKRPDDEVLWHVYVEIMGKYSNVVLVNSTGAIVTAAHQVSDKQSRVRPIQTGQHYELPPALLEAIPSALESFDQWRDRLALIPQTLKRSLLTNYRGTSGVLVRSLCLMSKLKGEISTDDLSLSDWQNLYQTWQLWIRALETKQFSPHLLDVGYAVIGGKVCDRFLSTCSEISSSSVSVAVKTLPVVVKPDSDRVQNFSTVNDLLRHYYTEQIYRQEFQQIYQQVNQVIQTHLGKQQAKAHEFQQRLQQSDRADFLKAQADLLMSYLHEWQPGMSEIIVVDFITSEPVRIQLDPQYNAIQNAQRLYKQHQKQKRARGAIMPLLESTNQEIHYLEQVSTAATQLEANDLKALEEIRVELIQQGYLKSANYRAEDKQKNNKSGKSNKSKKPETIDCHRYHSPNGFEIWIGRNNFQNDAITSRIANEYDLWFHTQEIPGSHVLLRLEPGSSPDLQDLQTAANLAAYYSRARQSEQVPVVFTKPKHVYKPKGAKPGMVVYKQEQVIWAQPHVSIPAEAS